jgi:hypothetical protein
VADARRWWRKTTPVNRCARLLLAALCVAAASGSTGTAASPGSAASGATAHVVLGVLGDPDRFDQQTTQRSRFRLLIMSWGQGGSPHYFSSLFATMREVPMLGLSTGGGEGGGAEAITAGRIAAGAGDPLLVALNQAIADWDKPIYVRPLAEMNGHWNAYCAFNRDGSARSADHSTLAFRKGFARIYLLLHGGPDVNRRLRQLGLPPVSGALASNTHVRVIWNPQGYGSPDIAGNSAESTTRATHTSTSWATICTTSAVRQSGLPPTRSTVPIRASPSRFPSGAFGESTTPAS